MKVSTVNMLAEGRLMAAGDAEIAARYEWRTK